MNLLEQALLAFLTERYAERYDAALEASAPEQAQLCHVWYALAVAANLTQAALLLRPRVHTARSIAGQAMREIAAALQEVQ